MNMQTTELDLGGHKFFITRLPATAGQDLLVELLQGVGPALGSLVEKIRLSELLAARAQGKAMADVIATIDLTGFGEVVRKFVMAMGKKEWRSIASQALATTACATMGGKRVWEGQAPLVDALNLTVRQLNELVWAALAWNFADFFSGPSASGQKQAEGPDSKA